jgi:AAA15 family ATPase/GTPase
MVKEIKIQNYKSVQDLTLELGRINVLIGANGCGKSNILEAIAFGSAAAEYKLSNEFLSSRGIRVTDPVWMRSGFNKQFANKSILIDFNVNDNLLSNEINHQNTSFSEWSRKTHSRELTIAGEIDSKLKFLAKKSDDLFETAKKDKTNLDMINEELGNLLNSRKNLLQDFNQNVESHIKLITDIENFLIYAPENTFLRRFEEESQIEPLGIRGEGLFKLLSVMSQETPEEFQEIIENLELIDWFDGFEIPKDLVFTERRIRIKDRFLEEGLQYFDQRSSNEGFLFLMFYFALFISKYTPKFFAIDNIDASLNPKLCIELIKTLTKLAKKHDKQVIFTTHNPAILDGLNLNDDEVRLMVVSRNKEGHTKTKRITPTIVPEGEKPVRLSIQFMRGYIGGLPKNF